MHPSLTTSYLLPAILLNPVLFLHSLNTILSRILPPIVTANAIQPAPYSVLGPSANHPHLDVHASDNLCWSYTALMVCAQLVAFGRVSQSRAEGRERRDKKKEEKLVEEAQIEKQGEQASNGRCKDQNGSVRHGRESPSDMESEVSAQTEDEMIL